MNYSTPLDYINSKLDERRTEIEQHLGRSAADRKSTRLNSSHSQQSRMPSSA